MFNLIRSISTHIGLSTFNTSIHRLFSLSLSSSAPNSRKCSSSNKSFTVSYLIDSCGFPPEKAILASKYITIKTPNKPDSVIAFFIDRGFTKPQVFHLVQKFPIALACNPQTNLLPKFNFLSSIGLSGFDIVKLVTARPNSLRRSLNNHIIPAFNLLSYLLQSKDRTLIAIKRCAWVLDWDFQADMLPNLQLLREIGVPGSKMLYLLTYQPRDFLVNTEQFKKSVSEVLEMGFDPLKTSFLLAIHAFRSMSKLTWEKKVEAYAKWGWSKDEVLCAFKMDPWCMVNSEAKIDKVMDFLVNKMEFEASFVAKRPGILSLSLEKRIVPRCLVYQYLLDNGVIEKKNGFSFWLKCSEIGFVDRLKRFEKESQGVLKFYQEKLDHPS